MALTGDVFRLHHRGSGLWGDPSAQHSETFNPVVADLSAVESTALLPEVLLCNKSLDIASVNMVL